MYRDTVNSSNNDGNVGGDRQRRWIITAKRFIFSGRTVIELKVNVFDVCACFFVSLLNNYSIYIFVISFGRCFCYSNHSLCTYATPFFSLFSFAINDCFFHANNIQKYSLYFTNFFFSCIQFEIIQFFISF